MENERPGPDASPPPASIVSLFMNYWIASAILAAANLGVADAVGDTPRPVDDIAREIGVDPANLFRLMNDLSGAGVFRQPEPRRFAHTPLSASLRTGAAGNAREVIRMFGLKSTREAMVEYEEAIRTGRSAFEIVHGSASPFDCLAKRPDEAAIYHAGMSLETAVVASIVERFDFADVKTLVDVGGGRGTLLSAVLRKNAGQRGVLFDLPEVANDARRALDAQGLSSRCAVVSGDFNDSVPASGDGYILKNILHGLTDDACRGLLDRIRRAAAPGARVFIIENVMPEGDGPAPCKVFDLFLLLGGHRSKVRSEAELRALMDTSGYVLERVVPIHLDNCVVAGRLC